MSKNKHLTLDNRITIQTELDKGSSFKEIGLILGKDCTTISKEVRKHIHKEKTGAMGRAFNDCLTDPAGPAVNVWDPVSLMSLIPAPASSALLMSATPAGTVPNAPWKNLSTAQSLLIGIMMP